jgi:hypothetical protein
MAHAAKKVSVDDTCASWRGLNALVGVLTLTLGIGAISAGLGVNDAFLDGTQHLHYKERQNRELDGVYTPERTTQEFLRVLPLAAQEERDGGILL